MTAIIFRMGLGLVLVSLAGTQWAFAIEELLNPPATEVSEETAHSTSNLPREIIQIRADLAKGNYLVAGDLAWQLLETIDSALPPGNSDEALGLDVLVEALWRGGRAGKPEALYLAERVVHIKEETLGREHIEVAVSLRNLASIQLERGVYLSAERSYRRALHIRQQAYPENHPDVATSLYDLGRIQSIQGEFVAADTLLSKSLSIRRQRLGETSQEVASSMHSLAVVRRSQERFRASDSLFDVALHITEENLGRDHPKAASILHDWAILKKNRAQLDKSQSLLEESVSIRKSRLGPAHPDVAASLASLASVHMQNSQFELCERLNGEALDILTNSLGSNHPAAAFVLTNLARLYYVTGRLQEAEKYFKNALHILESIFDPDHMAIGAVINNLGGLYAEMGKFILAAKYYQHSLHIAQKNYPAEHAVIAKARGNKATVLQSQGQYTAAERSYRKALDIWRAIGDTVNVDFAICCGNMAALQRELGRFERAELLLKRSVSLLRDLRGADHPDLIPSLTSLGNLYADHGKVTEAELLFMSALDLFESAYGSDHPKLVPILNNLARVHGLQGNYGAAEQGYLRALANLDKFPGSDNSDMAHTLANLARLHMDLQDYSLAEGFLLRCLPAMLAFDKLDPQLAEIQELFALLKRNQGQPGIALRFASNAVTMRRNHYLTNASTLPENQALLYSRAWKRSVEQYVSCFLDLNPSDSELQSEAASIILSSKGTVSDAAIERAQRIARLTAVSARLRNAEEQRMAFRRAGPGENYTAYSNKMDSLLQAVEGFREELSQNSPLLQQSSTLNDIDIMDVTWGLPKKSALVDFLSFDYLNPHTSEYEPRYAVLVLKSGSSPEVLDLGDAREIDDLIDRYREHLIVVSRASSRELKAHARDYKELGRAMYDLIWSSIESRVEDRDLVLIAPDGGLNLVSFGGLVRADGSYLIENLALHYLSSGRDLIRLHEPIDPIEAGTGLLALADPDFDASLAHVDSQAEESEADSVMRDSEAERGRLSSCAQFNNLELRRLPGTRQEINLIESVWQNLRGESAKVFLGAEATEEKLKRFAGGSRVIHLATHGFYYESMCGPTPARRPGPFAANVPRENPLLLSGLFLAGANRHADLKAEQEQDGILTGLEVSHLDLNGVQLVVLSACESGLGKVRESEGVYGLRRAFQMAGARTVISSLWSVPDSATAELMSELYSASLETIPVRLQRIQLQLIDSLRSRGESDHPFSWAAFIAMGDWH